MIAQTTSTTVTDVTTSIYSTGYLSQLMQRSVAEIVAKLESLGHKPTIFVNGIPHYNEAALCDLRKSFRSNNGE